MPPINLKHSVHKEPVSIIPDARVWISRYNIIHIDTDRITIRKSVKLFRKGPAGEKKPDLPEGFIQQGTMTVEAGPIIIQSAYSLLGKPVHLRISGVQITNIDPCTCSLRKMRNLAEPELKAILRGWRKSKGREGKRVMRGIPMHIAEEA